MTQKWYVTQESLSEPYTVIVSGPHPSEAEADAARPDLPDHEVHPWLDVRYLLTPAVSA